MISNTFGCKGTKDKIGVLVAQLGSPDSPTPKALRKYLKQFLSDPRIIEVNRLVWWFVLNGVILNTRPRRSARLYSRIWWPEGSPLVVITKRQTDALRKKMQQFDGQIEVEFGMRYGSPSLESAIDKLVDLGCARIALLPMFPQYSATTTGSTYDAVFRYLLNRRSVPALRVIAPYYRDKRYIGALAETINSGIERLDFIPERLVLSYHGIPIKYVKKGDPYCCMCMETTAAFTPLLKMGADKVIHTYQSRFGKDPWLQPYTDVTIENLAKQGVRNIAVACPGFTADCLETLDEIGNEARELFHEHGGERLELIPSVNDQQVFISALSELVRDELHGWHDADQRLAAACLKCPLPDGI